MFIRKKKNDSGVISIQILRKHLGKNTLLETVGKTKESRLFLPNEEQRTLLKLFQIT